MLDLTPATDNQPTVLDVSLVQMKQPGSAGQTTNPAGIETTKEFGSDVVTSVVTLPHGGLCLNLATFALMT